MIGLLLDILALDDFYGVSKEIDIAKGKNELALTVKKRWKQYKRKQWRK